jgi:hypothetical protein
MPNYIENHESETKCAHCGWTALIKTRRWYEKELPWLIPAAIGVVGGIFGFILGVLTRVAQN